MTTPVQDQVIAQFDTELDAVRDRLGSLPGADVADALASLEEVRAAGVEAIKATVDVEPEPVEPAGEAEPSGDAVATEPAPAEPEASGEPTGAAGEPAE